MLHERDQRFQNQDYRREPWRQTYCFAEIMNVLISTDGSPEATAALRAAMRLLKTSDRKVDLLCVAPRFARYELRQEVRTQIFRQTIQILSAPAPQSSIRLV